MTRIAVVRLPWKGTLKDTERSSEEIGVDRFVLKFFFKSFFILYICEINSICLYILFKLHCVCQ